MTREPEKKRARLPVEDPLSTDRKRSPTLASRAIPRRFALWALTVDLRAPARVTPGEPARFQVSIRNRLPVGVSVELPTSRVWGWAVDGVPEADERGFEPPDEPRTVAFGRRERRVFEGRWDGTVRQSGIEGDVWVPVPGTHTLSAFLAVPDPDRWGVAARTTVAVESPRGESADGSRP